MYCNKYILLTLIYFFAEINTSITETSHSTLTEESGVQDELQQENIADFAGSLVGFTAATLNEIYDQ